MDLRRFMRREQNVVVGRVFPIGEFLRGEMPTQMIASSRRDVHRAEDLLVLDIATRDWQELRTETEFSDFAGYRIGPELMAMFNNGGLIAAEQFGCHDSPSFNGHQSDGTIFVFQGELA